MSDYKFVTVWDIEASIEQVWDVIEDAAFIRVNPCAAMPLPGPVHVNAPLHFEKLAQSST